MTHPTIGQTVTCAHTGRPFVIAQQGCTFNYARDSAGRIYSDEGVIALEEEVLKDHAAPIVVYVSSDERTVTTWKGHELGRVVRQSSIRNPFGGYLTAYTVRDKFGAYWHGRGAGAGMCLRLRPSKA